MMQVKIKNRHFDYKVVADLEKNKVHPLLAKVYAARGVSCIEDLNLSLSELYSPNLLKDAAKAGVILADALQAQKRILIVADYDCDGATACALALRVLRRYQANIDFLVPSRDLGYGLTPALVEMAAAKNPDLLLTVDNGISSLEGIYEAKRRGWTVIVTDHHLIGDQLPDADAIVNPNQPECDFPSKNLSGVGVIFYTLLALRIELRKRGETVFPMDFVLDLVALGTVSDLVPLDKNNRILISEGLKRLRKKKTSPGIRALFGLANRSIEDASTEDLAFYLGPRINAAGRLTTMTVGIECLSEDDESSAFNYAFRLNKINQERKVLQTQTLQSAQAMLESIHLENVSSIVLFSEDWPAGVVGLVASYIKDEVNKPTIIFSRSKELLTGSGRSISSMNIRDAIDWVSKKNPGLVLKFGGHAAAAGLTIRQKDFSLFQKEFDNAVIQLGGDSLSSVTYLTDGQLENSYYNLDTAVTLRNRIWGSGFPAPLFDDYFEVLDLVVMKEKHLRITLKKEEKVFQSIFFNPPQLDLPKRIRVIYSLGLNEYLGKKSPKLLISYCEEA